MAAGSNAPVIIKRKKVIAGGGHHGGAWKVAMFWSFGIGDFRRQFSGIRLWRVEASSDVVTIA